jgi:demethoxyubiquinone hydroxylase (CLK1/Coq7/Cat5 family)
MPALNVTGTFTIVSDDVVGFAPDRNAPAGVPRQVLASAFTSCPGVPVGLVVKPGVPTTMAFDTATQKLDFTFDKWNDADIAAAYPDGSVTLALVQSVTRQSAVVNIHPTHTITMTREDVSGNPKDVLDGLLRVGDVLAVRTYRGPNGQLKVRSSDIDDDEPVIPAPSITTDGEPWLAAPSISSVIEIVERFTEEKRKIAEANDAMSKLAEQFDTDIEQLREVLAGIGTTTGEIPLPTAEQTDKQKIADSISAMATAHITRVITNYKREIRDLLEQNKSLAAALDKLTANDRELRANLSEARQRLQEKEKRAANGSDEGVVAYIPISIRQYHHATPEEWIREEIRWNWIESYTPDDRTRYPLDNSQFDILPSFVETFTALTDFRMVKAIRIATHVVTGRNTAENIAEVHDLREADGATAQSVTRADGAVCRRVYMESRTSQARRIHYWKLRDGRIEFSRVALHDDFTP